MGNTITSRNGRLEVGMTKESLQQKIAQQGMSESDRAAKKLLEAFNMADGLGEGGIKDGVISEKEIEAYDKEMKKKNWKTGLLIAGGVLVTGVVTYLTVKGIKANKLKNMTPEQLFEHNRAKALKQKASTAFAEVTPENFKGNGVSYLVDAEKSATPAFKLKIGKTVGETLEKNKEVGLELVQDANGKFMYGVKNPWTGWENLPNWKNEYGTKPFEELKKLYPDLDASKYFTNSGSGVIKAYGATIAEDGSVAIHKASNGVQDIAFQLNSTIGKGGAKDLVNITHVLEDGSAIKFDELSDGWNMVRKGQFNPANPSKPLPILQTAVGFDKAREIKTLEGVITSDVTMTDGGGFPYNKFKDFWKQLIRGKVNVNPSDPASVKMFEQVSEYNRLAQQLEGLKAAGTCTAEQGTAIEKAMQACQDKVKQIIISATK